MPPQRCRAGAGSSPRKSSGLGSERKGDEVSDTSRPVRVRIAPSPTGNAHVGTARNALYNLLLARQHGGQFILRIDDTDVKRSTAASEQGVYEGLRWLGLDWDEGPDVGGPRGPYRQSERLPLYRAAAQRLLDAGRAYRCFCTPEELAAERQAARATGRPPVYSGRCRRRSAAEVEDLLARGRSHVLRLAIEPGMMAFTDLVQGRVEQDAGLLSDPVIVKADGVPVYSFATVVDEQEMAISHVLRSAEHISNTFPQLQIYEALGYPPPEFAHLGLLLNPDRSKISKRTGAVYIGEFRDEGYLPEAMINHLALSGWSPGTDREIYSLDDLLEEWSLERCSAANAIFDRQKLLWLNGHYLRRLPVDDLARRAWPFLRRAGPVGEAPTGGDVARVRAIAGLEQERLKTLGELPEAVAFFCQDPSPADSLAALQENRFARRHTLAEHREALEGLAEVLDELPPADWAPEGIEGVLEARVESLGWKRGEVYMPVRIAVSGRTATPSLPETMALIGREAVLRRVRALVAWIDEQAIG